MKIFLRVFGFHPFRYFLTNWFTFSGLMLPISLESPKNGRTNFAMFQRSVFKRWVDCSSSGSAESIKYHETALLNTSGGGGGLFLRLTRNSRSASLASRFVAHLYSL